MLIVLLKILLSQLSLLPLLLSHQELINKENLFCYSIRCSTTGTTTDVVQCKLSQLSLVPLLLSRQELINKQKPFPRPPQVSWIRHRDLHVLTVSSFTFTNDERFSAHRDSSTGDWVLVLRHPEPSDSGYYECSISTKPVTAISVKLEVVGKYWRRRQGRGWCRMV